jgi:4-hydroxy-tetrahydrodipicolinate reductase
MGAAILNIAVERGHKLTGAFDAAGSKYSGMNATNIVNNSLADCIVTVSDEAALSKTDGVIDFSAPAATLLLLKQAKVSSTPLVIGTTGFNTDEINAIREASGTIPLLFSPNMSLGVNLLFKLTELASSALTTDYDVEIFESHHRFKKDAPSGTAKRLLEIVRENMNGLASARTVNGREGITGERPSAEIGMHAMRGGNIIGEHTVFYVGMDERIELTHRAAGREAFARGAIAAMEFLAGKKPGLYSMYDVLGI